MKLKGERSSRKDAVYVGRAANGKKLYKHSGNTRISCICKVRTAKMIFNGIVIGTISEEKNDAYEFDWVIKIDWPMWEKAGKPQVAGIDMDLRLDEYIRTYIPAFVEERTLPDNRDGLYEKLEELGLNYNDRFEYMCRTHGRCGPSDITVERMESPL